MLRKISRNILLILVGILVLNASIDNIDFKPLSTQEAFSEFNYINSFVEYIAEYSLGHKDLFKETGNNHPKKSNSLKSFHINIVELNTTNTDLLSITAETSLLLPRRYTINISKGFAEGEHKPPDVV